MTMALAGHTKAAPVGWTRAVEWSRLSMVAALGLGVALLVAQVAHLTPLAQDAWVYWHAQPGSLYADAYRISQAPYGYSPAFADALIPFRLLPERVFTGLWQLGLVVVLVVTVRGWALPLLVLGFLAPWPLDSVASDVALGNIHVLLGAVAVFGLRWPALWGFALLSKVTPGVGIVWFLARKEWRNLAIVLAMTGALALASFVFVPGDWFAWARFVMGGSPDFPLYTVPVPLPVRLAMSFVAVWWGARTDRPWVVPLACAWAVPIPYATMLACAVCALAYVSRRGAAPAGSATAPSPLTPSARG